MADRQPGGDHKAVLCHVLPQARPQVRQSVEGAQLVCSHDQHVALCCKRACLLDRQADQECLRCPQAAGATPCEQGRGLTCRLGARPQVWFGSRVVVVVADPELGRLVSRNPNRHAYPHLGDLKSAADNASFFSSITTARECAPAARRPPAAGCAGG